MDTSVQVPPNRIESPTSSTPTANDVPTQHIDAAGVSIGYRVLGRAMKVPLVMLQRFRGTMDDWDPALLDALAKKRQVILFDSAGIGTSTGQVPGSIDEMARVTGAFLDALGLTEVDLLGYSLGGQVALTAALEYPAVIRRLVVAASSPGGVPNSPALEPRIWSAARRDAADMDDFLAVFFPETPEGRGHGYEHFARLNNRGEVTPAVTPQAFATQYDAMMALHASDAIYGRLPTLQQPTLFACGVRDLLFPPYDSFAAVERVPHGQLIVYPDAAHAFLFQAYDRFASFVHDFLDRVEHAPASLVPAPP
jgi:pimeloyl-ACP methyl ester carboxylesterase